MLSRPTIFEQLIEFFTMIAESGLADFSVEGSSIDSLKEQLKSQNVSDTAINQIVSIIRLLAPLAKLNSSFKMARSLISDNRDQLAMIPLFKMNNPRDFLEIAIKSVSPEDMIRTFVMGMVLSSLTFPRRDLIEALLVLFSTKNTDVNFSFFQKLIVKCLKIYKAALGKDPANADIVLTNADLAFSNSIHPVIRLSKAEYYKLGQLPDNASLEDILKFVFLKKESLLKLDDQDIRLVMEKFVGDFSDAVNEYLTIIMDTLGRLDAIANGQEYQSFGNQLGSYAKLLSIKRSNCVDVIDYRNARSHPGGLQILINRDLQKIAFRFNVTRESRGKIKFSDKKVHELDDFIGYCHKTNYLLNALRFFLISNQLQEALKKENENDAIYPALHETVEQIIADPNRTGYVAMLMLNFAYLMLNEEDEARIMSSMATVFAALNLMDHANGIIAYMLEKYPDVEAVLLSASTVRFLQEEYVQARVYVEQILEKTPESLAGLHMMAIYHIATNDDQGSITYLIKALDIYPAYTQFIANEKIFESIRENPAIIDAISRVQIPRKNDNPSIQ